MNNQIQNPKPEINPARIGKLFHGELAKAHELEVRSIVCEKLGKDESIPSVFRVKYLEQSIAFRGLALEIYNICSPVNSPAHV